jgi:hypothetical protein
MAPYKRTDPGKIARNRELARKSIEAMEKPKVGPIEVIKDLDKRFRSYVGRRMKEKTERAMGYGPSPAIEGAYVKGLPSDISGAVTSLKSKKKSVA